MAVTTEIVRSWRGPGATMRRLLPEATEARALAYLMAACFFIFVAQWPRLSREAHLMPEVPLDARMGAALLGWVFIAPLFFYALAALSHLMARLFGGRGNWLGARLALFWSLLVAAPLFLLHGLVSGFIGPGAALNVTGLILTIGFLTHWLLALSEAERIEAS